MAQSFDGVSMSVVIWRVRFIIEEEKNKNKKEKVVLSLKNNITVK